MPGILWGSDFDRLRASAARVVDRFRTSDVHFVEIGTEAGHTARDLIESIKVASPRYFVYFGIDPNIIPVIPYPYTHIKGLSHRKIGDIGPEIHWVFVDGCHCAQCVARDAILYGNLIVPGGEMCFHDASPKTQGLDPQGYDGNHHNVEIATCRGIDVRRFLDEGLLGGFELVERAPDQERGGVEVYRKL